MLSPFHHRLEFLLLKIARIFENKRFSSFYTSGPITFMDLRTISWEVRLVQTVCLRRWTLNFVGPFAKELKSLMFSEIVVIGQSSSRRLGSSSRATIDFARPGWSATSKCLPLTRFRHQYVTGESVTVMKKSFSCLLRQNYVRRSKLSLRAKYFGIFAAWYDWDILLSTCM